MVGGSNGLHIPKAAAGTRITLYLEFSWKSLALEERQSGAVEGLE